MDVDAVKEKSDEAPAKEGGAPLPGPVAAPADIDAVKVGKNQCRVCLQEGRMSWDCPQNTNEGNCKGKGKYGKVGKGFGRGKGKLGKDAKGKGGKGQGGKAYGVEEQWQDNWYGNWAGDQEASRQGPLWSLGQGWWTAAQG